VHRAPNLGPLCCPAQKCCALYQMGRYEAVSFPAFQAVQRPSLTNEIVQTLWMAWPRKLFNAHAHNVPGNMLL
jgi:hypothetical protein